MSQWQPLYLRATDEAAMIEALAGAGLVGTDETGQQIIGGDPLKIRVHVFGVLYDPSDVIDVGTADDPAAEPLPVALEGYHTNVTAHPDHAEHYATALAPVLLDPAPDTPLITPAL